jgi:Ca2+-binding EF-hand superfamily protein
MNSMKRTTSYALLLGAAVAVGTGVAVAKKDGPAPAPAATAASVDSSFAAPSGTRGRFAERFLAEFDTNHDGKVTHDEFNRTLAHEFAVATNGAPMMTLDQFAAMHLKDLRGQAADEFHRVDWNGDGKVSADEYMSSERDRFEALDRDGTGVIACGSSRGRSASDPSLSRSSGGSSGRGAGSRGRSSLCFSDDLNKDGQVTRAEFDRVTQQQFNAFAKGGNLTPEQFYQLLAAQSRAISVRVFQRLDKDRDGKLTLQEFAASQERLFTRLDKRNDGVITEDELVSSRRSKLASQN